MLTKAFEARESQWNRKLSIKHSEEKKLNQQKSLLTISIVRSFEDARNYYQNESENNAEEGKEDATSSIVAKIPNHQSAHSMR